MLTKITLTRDFTVPSSVRAILLYAVGGTPSHSRKQITGMENQNDIIGRLIALEMLVCQSLVIGLVPVENKDALVAGMRDENKKRVERLLPEIRAAVVACSDRVLDTALASSKALESGPC